MTTHALRGRTRYPGVIDGRMIPTYWWLAGVISPSNVLSAYRAKRADSYKDSKINLANPGTYDLSDVNAPAWTAENGWDFEASSSHNLLIANGGFNLKPGTVIARIKENDGWGLQTLLGSTASDVFQFRTNGSYKPELVDAGQAVIATASTALSVATDHVIAVSYDAGGNYAFYLDGTPDGSGTNDRAIGNKSTHIGRNYDGYYWDNYVYALAFYSVALTSDQVAAVTTAMQAL